MKHSRRRFLVQSAAGLAGGLAASAAVPDLAAQQPPASQSSGPPPGQPPAFATAPAVGPEVSASTFAEAEKLVRVEFTAPQLSEAAQSWRDSMAPLYERRTGPRKVALEDTLAPWSTVRAVQPGISSGPARDRFVRSQFDPGPLPSNEEDIAWAPVTRLSRWIEQRKLTSERLTNIYLERLRRYDPELHCVITLTGDRALQQARRADAEIAAGHYRGPLHGIPWGAKDLLDTAG
ncbi:MAG: amidase family protein, partial [Acidobacteriota bacterium]